MLPWCWFTLSKCFLLFAYFRDHTSGLCMCILVCCILVSYWKQSLHRRVSRQKSYLELFGLCDSGLSHTGQATGRSMNNVYSSTSWQAAVGFLCNRLRKPDTCMDRVQSMTLGNLQSLEKNLYSLTGFQGIHLFTKMQKDKIKDKR